MHPLLTSGVLDWVWFPKMATSGASFFICRLHPAVVSTTRLTRRNLVSPTTPLMKPSTYFNSLVRTHFMANADLKSAFRLCPVHPLDWPLLGIQWRNQYFIDKCLPFGLRSSSPYLFNLVADALQWCLLHHYGVNASFHYLDDFFFAGPSGSGDCHWAITSFQSLCSQLGVPLNPEKLVSPITTMTFLGIQLDSVQQVASLPLDKLAALLTSLRQHIQLYRDGSTVTKRSLLSLIGKLSFATKVIPAGRIFLRRLLDLAHSVPHLEAPPATLSRQCA